MVTIIQILFVLLIVAMAIVNAISVLSGLANTTWHSAPRARKTDIFSDEDPGEIARRHVTHLLINTELDRDEIDIGDFIDFDC